MSHAILEDISQTQKDRLFHIDFKLRFLGAINRNDLVTRFGIKEAAATRVISLYKEVSPQNLTYDAKAKSYTQTGIFKPVFKYPGSQALSALCHGLGDDHIGNNRPLVIAELPTQFNFPDLEVLATITKSIHLKKVLKIDYRSLSSGVSTREIIPFALVDNGLRWHARAYDRKRKRFTDFVINRIAKPKLLESDIPEEQTREADIQWNRSVEMHIVPHPHLTHPETIEAEYAMTNGVLKIQVRAAVTGYVLRKWNVDCSENHKLNGQEHHLWLENTPTLYGVENLTLAPGFERE